VRRWKWSFACADASVVEQPERGGCHRQAQVWQILLVRDILSRQTDTPLRLVVSGTEVAGKFFVVHPQVFIHCEYSSKVMGRSSSVRRRSQWTEEVEAGRQSADINPRAFVVLDDLGFDAEMDKRTRV
jgi:hypothetical protein